MQNDLEITGSVAMMLYATSKKRDTDFTAKLIDVFPDDYSMIIFEGIIHARYRHDDSNPKLLGRGEVTKYEVQLYPTSNVFKVGQRNRINFSNSDFPRFSRNLNTGECNATGTTKRVARQTVLHSTEYPSAVLLPVVPR